MKLFELKGTLRLYAENLDNAFQIIGTYYSCLGCNLNTEPLGEVGTDITLEKIKEENSDDGRNIGVRINHEEEFYNEEVN